MGDHLQSLGSEAEGLESNVKDELCMDIDPPFSENSATADDWRKALSKVVPAVVVLRTTACRAFDTEAAGASYATGFVVDKLRGIILTNRHVVKSGPVVAEAMFVNREEIPVYPIYRDPVHDFGFFRYDPAAIQFHVYEEIPLAPESACVGLEIRVVGNDSGEKVSILAGTLARLDRDAPHYKKDGYNDFNTFYMQAASGTKGGSSGSPVIDWQGRAVALNAGSKSSSASAFFLPLERVVRALKFLQNSRDLSCNKWEAVSIPRGTLQVTFLHKGFDETRRLGLQSETEQMVRHASPPGETGMLVVDSVVPGGPAYNCLEPGDVLVRMNGKVITQFLKMETLLDESVNQKVELQIERGGTSLNVDLTVQDLHSITPDYFLEVSGAVIHPLSYQQARNFRFNCGLVYVTEPGYMLFRAGVPRHAIIKKFAGEEISQLEELISILSKLSRGARVPLEYVSYTDRHRRKSVLVTVDRHEWYAPPQIYKRDDSTGLWNGKPAFQPVSMLPSSVNGLGVLSGQEVPLSTEGTCIEHMNPDNLELTDGHGVASMETNCELVLDETNSRVEVDLEVKKRRVHELSVDGNLAAEYTVPGTRNAKLEDPITMENAMVREYQGATPVAANASFPERMIEPTLVMFEVYVPPSCMLDGVHSQHFFGTGVVIYHSGNMGLAAVDKNTVAISASDVMLSFAAFPIEIPGEVVFLHPAHNYALISYDPSALGPVGASAVRAAELLPEPLRRGDSVYLVGLSRSLQATSRKSIVTNPCAALNIGSADCPRYRATNMEVIELDTDFGSSFSGVLTDEQGRVQAIWGSFSTQALVKKDPVRRQVLRVKGCFAGSKAENQLEQGDMVLAINKEPVTCFQDIEDACHALDKYDNNEGKLNITIFRQGREIDLQVGTDVRDGSGTTRVINWCGCIVQDPHPAVRALGFLPEEGHGVYVARWCHGSPVHRYGLYALQWIVEVNGKPTPNLDAFADVTKGLEHGEFVRIRTVHLNGKPRVLTLKQDLHYWPTWELRFDADTATWRRTVIKTLG
ncbi:protease Do-like 7 isoform X3 [Cannabis sativa]|uniref:protease Do-like 7 isoform X3 n=1 Tax=Cannabis sativa TaxID=3483 RepID=UPI0029C9E59D|nr:protease Do-like 7 isoform X3 [Cannabis sativa]